MQTERDTLNTFDCSIFRADRLLHAAVDVFSRVGRGLSKTRVEEPHVASSILLNVGAARRTEFLNDLVLGSHQIVQ
jgi:hypothetical protein